MGAIAGMGYASAINCETEGMMWGLLGAALGFIGLLLL